MQQWNHPELQRIAKIAHMSPKYLQEIVRYLRKHLLIIVKL